MFCKKCGTEIKSGKFCPKCGTESSSTVSAAQPEVKSTVQMKQEPVNNNVNSNPVNNEIMAPVMSVWGYVGMFLLGMIPLVGTIMVIVFAVSDSNLNRRNYCRAIILIWVISALLVALCWGAIGGMAYGLLYS